MTARGDHRADIASRLETAERLRRAGNLATARASFAEAAKAAEAADDHTSFLRAALGVGGLWINEQRDLVGRATVASIWQRAEQLAPPGSIEGALLAVRRLAEAVYEGSTIEAVMEAVERVRAFHDDAATGEALSLLHHVQLGPRYVETRLAMAEEIVVLGAKANDPLVIVMGLCWRTVDLFLIGDPRAGQSLAELRERASADRCEAVSFIADLLDSMALARSGHFDKAEASASAALERGLALGDPDAPAYFGAMLGALRWWQGRAADILDLVRATSTSPRLGFNDHVYVAADGLLSATLGDVDAAEEALARLGGIGYERLPHSSSWLTTLFLAAETAYLLGDAASATAIGEVVAPYAHLPVMPSLAVVCFGSVERTLGLSAITSGRVDAAVHHLDAAIRADRRLGSRPMAVLTEHTLAAVMGGSGTQSDRRRAEQLARRASDRARRMGIVLPTHPAWLAPQHLSARMAPHREASLLPSPRGWRLVLEGRTTIFADLVGFRYLSELLARPNQHIAALTLAAQGAIKGSMPQPVVDARALGSYRRRADELRRHLEGETRSTAELTRCRQELNGLDAVIRSASGFGGRIRAFPNTDERARTAVRKALVRAMVTIEVAEPDLAHHLRTSIETGVTCRYSPSPGWKVITTKDGTYLAGGLQAPERGTGKDWT